MAESTTVTETTRTTSRGITALRKDYDRLATACTEAKNAGNKPEWLKLMDAKKAAHKLFYDAYVADRHEKRDAAKANGATPGVR